MSLSELVSVGIDCTSGEKTFTYAVLDRDLRLAALAPAELQDLTSFLAAQKSVIVAINSPSHVSSGEVRRRLERRDPKPHNFRGVDLREAEHELRLRGIVVSATPAQASLCPAWVQVGFALYGALGDIGFQASPYDGAGHQWLETHPHAAFCALLGRVPLPKPTLEGRLQRALALFEKGVRIRDPMDFLEEITRHRLLHGVLPTDMLYSPQQLDALVAALTAWLAAVKPDLVTRIGSEKEGFITLPVPKLLDKY